MTPTPLSPLDRIRRAKQAALQGGAVPPAELTRPTVDRRQIAPRRYDADESYVSPGMDGLLASTETLLAVNRGLRDPDERDSWAYKRFYTTPTLLRERVALDPGKSRRKMLAMSARRRSLQGWSPFAFDDLMLGHLIGNPLSSPLEEINPLQLVDQSRRITQMGPGGVGSDNAITEGMQCHSEDTEVFTRRGWKFWPEVCLGDELACRVDGAVEFHTPTKLHAHHYEGNMHGIVSVRADFLVTPCHRFFSASTERTGLENWKWETAQQQKGKIRVHLCVASPYLGTDHRDAFQLEPAIREAHGVNLRQNGPIDMGDWCEFLGWYLAEGSCATTAKAKLRRYSVIITQSETANPEKVARIAALLGRLPFTYQFVQGKNFVMHSKQLHAFVVQFGKCLDKWIPDFLFEVKPEYRHRFLAAFLAGDGWTQRSGSGVYSSTSLRLTDDLERMLIGLGRPSTRGTPWMAKRRNGSPAHLVHRVNDLTTNVFEVKPRQQTLIPYSGMVYCATVPGQLLLTRRGFGKKPLWTGNSVTTSQFGFVSPLEGPECLDSQSEVYTLRGWTPWPDVKDDDVFACRIDGRLEWHPATRIVREHYTGDLIVAENATLRMAVTPTHRVIHKYRSRGVEHCKPSLQVAGTAIHLPARHEPELGDDTMTHFELPTVAPLSKYSAPRNYGPFEIGDWCEFMGWWLSEGSLFEGVRKDGHRTQRVEISQCPEANPDNRRKISELFRRMGLPGADGNGPSFVVTGLQFVDYFRRWTQGCLDKHIPEELFSAPLHARQRMFDALTRGDGTHTSKCLKYCSVSRRLAESVERLAFTLGFSAYTKQVGITSSGRPYFNARVIRHTSRSVTKAHWSRQHYNGMVYCATVPGGFLHVRGKPTTSGFWTGNSERVGVDSRLSWGVKLGSDGRIYQRFRDRKTGKLRWLSPRDLDGKTVKLPD